ncbi:hypothetical protein [Enterobacter chuandaensis]|uniref:hypothetical protein n=1 Tax=Enterobacter chuandaensis TaxID=2497875 RepID=UPI00300C5119
MACRPEHAQDGIDHLYQTLAEELPLIAPFFLVLLPKGSEVADQDEHIARMRR